MAKRRPAARGAAIQHKNHGPKRHQFRAYTKCGRASMPRGLLNKYWDYESFCMALAGHGVTHDFAARWKAYSVLPFAQRKQYWADLNR